MSSGEFANFLTRLGHRVIETESGAWYDASRFFLLGIPTHELRTPGENEIRQLWRGRLLGVRYTTPLGAPGKLSYQIACDDSHYGLEGLSANTRSKVRRGLKRCDVRRITAKEVAEHGTAAQRDTLTRQGRETLLAGTNWHRFWEAVSSSNGMEIWSAWVDDKLASFLVTVDFGDTVEFMLARSRDDCLHAYPNNALLFHVAEEMLVHRGLREITFGIESLEPVGPLDQFKFAMGFRTKPLRQRVLFHPVVSLALRLAPIRGILRRWTETRDQSHVFWRKAAGLLRFAEEAGL